MINLNAIDWNLSCNTTCQASVGAPIPLWGLLQLIAIVIVAGLFLVGVAYFSNKTDWDKEVLKK